jgi:hypothetical protein
MQVMAPCKASTLKSVLMLIETRQASTRRLA